MYEIVFYRDKEGKEPVYEYMLELAKKNSKDARINLNKINDYIEILKQYGTQAGEPYIKHLDGDIWELRPIRNRILFAAWIGNNFVLLSHFTKKTQKTPKKEIEKAKKYLADFLERGMENE
ncbi:MAG: type II toxin-antitoxin system RelE/ParE family toxin [Eubacteriales bacterium]|nr:type II toxin-antitoxin system RelE/ParE family toxin [Eubacteriales bacterium]